MRVWLDQHGRRLKHGSRIRAERCVRQQLVYLAGHTPYKLTSDVLWDFCEWHLEHKGASPSTVIQSLAWLRRAVKLAWEGELEITWKPTKPTPVPRITRAIADVRRLYGHRTTVRQAFKKSEARLVIEAARERLPEFAPFVQLAFSTGLRRSELRALQWDCVDLDERVLHVRRNFSENELGTPKTEEHRAVNLSPASVEILRRLAMRARAHHPLEVPWVFHDGEGHYLTQSQTGHFMARVLAAARKKGLPAGLSLHSARHTFVSQGRKHMSDADVQAQAGHSEQMQKRYTHANSVDAPDMKWADFAPGNPD
jgi:integrase